MNGGAVAFATGVVYLCGDGVPQNDEKAFKYFGETSLYEVEGSAYMYETGRGNIRDPWRAMNLLCQKDANHCAYVQMDRFWSGFNRLQGHDEDIRRNNEVAGLKIQAAAGDSTAMIYLAFACLNKEVDNSEPNDGMKWLTSAADAGNADAMFLLATAEDSGAYHASDFPKQAMDARSRWLQSSAEHGNVFALRAFSFLSMESALTQQKRGSDGEITKPAEALALLQKAAETGDAESLVNLGSAYENGWLIERDLGKAVKNYQLASQKGSLRALVNLGLAYESGKGVPLDKSKGLECLREAARKGDRRARLYLLQRRLGWADDSNGIDPYAEKH